MLEIIIDKESQDRINAALKTLDPKEADNALFKGITKGATIALGALQDNVAGGVLHVRSGNLLRSLGMRVDVVNDEVTGTVGSGAQSPNPEVIELNEGEVEADPMFRMIYANILETGGTVSPTKCQYLAIPIGDALTAAGVARFTAQQLKDGLAPGYTDSVILNGVIFGINPGRRKENQLTPLFVLKPSVEIPAFRYMQTSIEQCSDDVVQALVSEIEKGLDKK